MGRLFSAHGKGLANPVTGEGKPDMENFDIEFNRPYRSGIQDKLYRMGPMPNVKYGLPPEATSKDNTHPPDPGDHKVTDPADKDDHKDTKKPQRDEDKNKDKKSEKQTDKKAKVETTNKGSPANLKDGDADLGGSLKGGLKIDNRTDQDVKVLYA